MANIGIQVNSIAMFRNPEDFLPIVKSCLKMEYEGMEFYRIYDVPAKELRVYLDTYGMVSAGNHIMVDELEDEKLLHKALEDAHILGSPYLICPRVPEHMMNSAEAYKKTGDFFNRVGGVCRREGMYLIYHHHERELEDLGGTCGLDIMMEYSEPENLGIQAEIFWVEFVKKNQAEFLKKYADRCVSMHIADMEEHNGEMIYTDLGDGMIDLESIVKYTENQKKLAWYVVEQEHYIRRPMFEAIAHDAVWLKDMRKRVAGEAVAPC